jgi:AcrR family transcriptional regulator
VQLVTQSVNRPGGRARATRRRIIDAAAELFVSGGYTTTTLEQIAARADVAVQTVYFHFGNKRTVLKEAVDVASVGDDEPVAMLDRPWLDEARAEQDPQRVIALWTAYGRDIMVRVGPIMRVVRAAAAIEDEMAQQWVDNATQTAAAFRVLAEQLDEIDALEVPIEQAVDILCALSGLDMYFLLTERGWSPQQWEEFVVDSVTHALLDRHRRQQPPATD